jgi:transcriptional regulator with XRE-family HTH domain
VIRVSGTSIPPPLTIGPQSLGEALRLLRHRTRSSRDELARAAGVSAGAISNYENDVSTPPAPTLRRVARALADLMDVDLSVLWEQLGQILDATTEGSGPKR